MKEIKLLNGYLLNVKWFKKATGKKKFADILSWGLFIWKRKGEKVYKINNIKKLLGEEYLYVSQTYL